MAIGLSLLNSFYYFSPDSLTFDPSSGNIFAGQTYNSTPTAAQPSFIRQLTQFTPGGQTVSSFTSSELNGFIGLSSLPNGNLLALSPINSRIVEITKSADIVPGGIDFTSSVIIDPPRTFIADIYYDAKTNTVFGVEGLGTSVIYQFDTKGNVLSTINLSASLPGAPLQAITIDPLTGNFLVAVDAGNGPSPGDNTIYEVTPSGQVIGSVDVEALTGIIDPEGLGLDPATRTLYVAFDTDLPSGATIYTSNTNRVAGFKLQLDTFVGDTGSNDVRTGDATANSFLGGLGNDNLSGGGGNDILDGGADSDTLNGNEGNDQVLSGSGNDFARGGAGDDFISGDSGDDILFGDRDNDTITGNSGNDTINGNAGNDSLLGGEGNDFIRGGQGQDFLGGNQGNDILQGDLGNDTINGGQGNDSLLGGSGLDVLNGGAGKDTLIGGASRDTFVLASGAENDIIADFTVGEDSIGLSGGLSFDQITFTQEITNNIPSAQILIAATGEILATVNGVTSGSLNRESFTLV